MRALGELAANTEPSAQSQYGFRNGKILPGLGINLSSRMAGQSDRYRLKITRVEGFIEVFLHETIARGTVNVARADRGR
jgi:hypothetical protein